MQACSYECTEYKRTYIYQVRIREQSVHYHNFTNTTLINSALLAADQCYSGFMDLCVSFTITTVYL